MTARWQNDGADIIVRENGEERRLNRHQALEYRSGLQWPEEWERFDKFVDRQLIYVDEDFRKLATAGIIQIDHAPHRTAQ